MNSLEQTPGPQYYPKEKPTFKSTEKYSFGFKRDVGGGLINKTACPASVGPGRYVPEASANPSQHVNKPRWTLPKAGRGGEPLKFDKNQTYDTRSGFGNQHLSKNRNQTKSHFGTSTRDGTDKLGVFKGAM